MQYIFASRISGAPITSIGGSLIDRQEVLNLTAEKITDLAEFLKEDAGITNAEDVFATILIVLVGLFRVVMPTSAIAFALSSVAAQILENSSYEGKQSREVFPQMPDGLRPNNN